MFGIDDEPNLGRDEEREEVEWKKKGKKRKRKLKTLFYTVARCVCKTTIGAWSDCQLTCRRSS